MKTESDELRRLAQETIDETDSTDWVEWRDAAKQLARKVLEQQKELDDYSDSLRVVGELDKQIEEQQAKIERLREALEEMLDAWEGYEMLSALDRNIQDKVRAAIAKAKGG